jgi:hypothetical protein
VVEIMSSLSTLTSTDELNKHQLNILSSLEHRIKIAKLEQNLQLVDLLEIEKKSIDPTFLQSNAERSPIDWLNRLINGLIDNFVPKTELQIKKLSDTFGNEWWYAYDPKTGKSVYADSDSEMRLWIESNYKDC